jgi:NTP pyrophosphatase (non-canonical NTP hydrolase)
MQINEYCKNAKRTLADLKYKEKDNLHMILGMLTEVGELADIFKKDLAYNKKIDWINAKEELGDLMWYVANFCNINNINLEEILQTNIDKLRTRYPEKFTEENAINRNLEAERIILEKKM